MPEPEINFLQDYGLNAHEHSLFKYKLLLIIFEYLE